MVRIKVFGKTCSVAKNSRIGNTWYLVDVGAYSSSIPGNGARKTAGA
jgi:hypothetical protein